MQSIAAMAKSAHGRFEARGWLNYTRQVTTTITGDLNVEDGIRGVRIG